MQNFRNSKAGTDEEKVIRGVILFGRRLQREEGTKVAKKDGLEVN